MACPPRLHPTSFAAADLSFPAIRPTQAPNPANSPKKLWRPREPHSSWSQPSLVSTCLQKNNVNSSATAQGPLSEPDYPQTAPNQMEIWNKSQVTSCAPSVGTSLDEVFGYFAYISGSTTTDKYSITDTPRFLFIKHRNYQNEAKVSNVKGPIMHNCPCQDYIFIFHNGRVLLLKWNQHLRAAANYGGNHLLSLLVGQYYVLGRLWI